MSFSPQSVTQLEELKNLIFVSYIRRKKSKKVVNALLSGASVFVPQDLSLPIVLKKSDICRIPGVLLCSESCCNGSQ